MSYYKKILNRTIVAIALVILQTIFILRLTVSHYKSSNPTKGVLTPVQGTSFDVLTILAVLYTMLFLFYIGYNISRLQEIRKVKGRKAL